MNTQTESEKLLSESIEKLKAEIAENEKAIEHLKFDLGFKKAKLRKIQKAIEPAKE